MRGGSRTIGHWVLERRGLVFGELFCHIFKIQSLPVKIKNTKLLPVSAEVSCQNISLARESPCLLYQVSKENTARALFSLATAETIASNNVLFLLPAGWKA